VDKGVLTVTVPKTKKTEPEVRVVNVAWASNSVNRTQSLGHVQCVGTFCKVVYETIVS
jgi:hypothetical protein